MKKMAPSKKVKTKYKFLTTKPSLSSGSFVPAGSGISVSAIGLPPPPTSMTIGIANSSSITLGTSKSLDGGDVRFIAGQAANGGKDGDIIFELADGTELIRFDSQGKVAVLGEPVSFEKIKKLLQSLKDPESCNCSSQQLLNGGCVCDGA